MSFLTSKFISTLKRSVRLREHLDGVHVIGGQGGFASFDITKMTVEKPGLSFPICGSHSNLIA
jgi:hypothetical protein